MLVAVAVDAVHRYAGDGGDLAMLVPGEHHHHVHFAALQLIDAGVGVGDELEEQRLDGRHPGATPVVRHRFEPDVFAALPLGDAIRPGTERRAIVIVGAVDIAAFEHVLRQCAADELQSVRRVNLPVVQHRGQRVRRVDAADSVEAVGAFGVVGRAVDRLDRELHVGGGMRRAVVPLDVGAQPPRHVHAAVLTQHDPAVLDRRHRRGQQRHDGHRLIGRDQSLHHARLDILENVRAEAIERVGLAVVAHDQAGGRADRDAPPGRSTWSCPTRRHTRRPTRRPRIASDEDRAAPVPDHDAASSASISFEISITGIAP